jgi:hypothetical protein
MRIPGISKTEAAELASALQKAMAQQKWQGGGGNLGDLEIRLQAGGQYDRDALVAKILNAMTSAISQKSAMGQ